MDGGVPLSEVMKWDLEDIESYHAVKSMQNDYQSAHRTYMEAEAAKKHKTET